LNYSSRDPERYHGLAFANTTRGWVVGDFLDSSHGWIGTDAGISSRAGETPPLFRTTDEGRTWSVEGRWPGTSVRRVWFRDTLSGCCAELNGLYSTVDGGRSWVKELDSGGDAFVQMAFTDESQGWALTFTGNVHRYSK
jgi:hypothetical protein